MLKDTRFKRELAILGLVLTLGAWDQPANAADAHKPPTWDMTGNWVVDDVICDMCKGAREKTEIGTRLKLSSTQIQNSLSGNCDRNPDYRLLKQQSSERVIDKGGTKWPDALKTAVRAQKTVVHGFITCDGGNYMQVVQTQPGVAFYFLEGDVVVRLKKQ